MSASDSTASQHTQPGAGGPGPDAAGTQLEEEELRAAYEAEMARITSADMILQSAVSLLNIAGHRLGLGPSPAENAPAQAPRDLEQVRDAIDAVRALLPILERRNPGEVRPLRDALSQLQMAYAREAAAAPPAPGEAAAGVPGAPPAGAETGPPPAEGQPGAGQPGGGQTGAPSGKPGPGPEPAQGRKPRAPGPAEASGRLWVPGR